MADTANRKSQRTDIIDICTSLCCILLVGIKIACAQQQLSPDYYTETCPASLWTIRAAVYKAVAADHRMGASLLRLHFHDCFVNGCDASILLNDTSTFTGEQNASPNAGSLRGFDVINQIKSQVERVCPGVVSCADIIALAAKDSVVALGGPSWAVQLGRKDSTTASLSAANSDLPSPIMDVDALITAFSKKGLTALEMVALSGAHTIGSSRCVVFRNRIYNESNIDSSFSTSLKSTCPTIGQDNSLAPLDTLSPNTFDNRYFQDLINSKGLMHSDQQLFNGNGSRSFDTTSQVKSYSTSSLSFFKDFAAAMVKMGNLGPPNGSSTQIRSNCAKVN